MQETDSTSVSLNPEASLFVPALRASHPTDLSLEAVACLPAGSTAKSDLSDGDNVSVSTEVSCLTDRPELAGSEQQMRYAGCLCGEARP